MPDSCFTFNYLFVRTLQRKTRWSDSFSEIFGFTENQRNGQLFAHIYQLKLIPPTGNITIKFYWLIVYIYGAQNEAYMSRLAEKWVRGLCFNELGVGG